MKSYTVYESPEPMASELEKAERMQFVREGFSWMAFFVPLLWMIYHRSWLVLILYIGVVFAIQLAAYGVGLNEEAIGIISVFLNLAMGFEGNNLRRWEFERQGYQLVGTVSGASMEECELKFFSEWLESEYNAADLTKLAAGTMTDASFGAPGRGY